MGTLDSGQCVKGFKEKQYWDQTDQNSRTLTQSLRSGSGCLWGLGGVWSSVLEWWLFLLKTPRCSFSSKDLT